MDTQQLREYAAALCKKAQALRAHSEKIRLSAHTRCHEIDAYVRDVWIGRNNGGRHAFEPLHSRTQNTIPQADHVKIVQTVIKQYAVQQK